MTVAPLEAFQDAEAFLEAEIARQRQAQTVVEDKRSDAVFDCLFDKERELAEDPKRFLTACCGRRAGKTYTVATMLLRAARRHPRYTVLYLHLTRDGAKGIIWPTLKQLNERFSLGGQVNEADLTMTMRNGAVIALRGVDKRREIEKRRGYGFALVVIDECQSIPEYVETLVDEVIGPALADVPGRLVMIGTPSLLAAGYWHRCHRNQNPIWGHYEWTMWDNPHIADPDQAFADECERRGVAADNVSMLREWRGMWVRDDSSAVFKFKPEANTFAALPADVDPLLWRYVISVDLGGGVERDNDAITVQAFHRNLRATWLVEEDVFPKADVTTVAEKVVAIRTRLGPSNVTAVAVDTGGIGAKVALEMQRRHRIPTVAAKKADKWANIELLNAACLHGEFFALPGSQFAQEAVKVEKDWAKSTPTRIAIKGHMPDVCDSVLYGFVESLGWRARPPPTTKEQLAAELQAAIAKQVAGPSKEDLENRARLEMAEYSRELARRQRRAGRQNPWGW